MRWHIQQTIGRHHAVLAGAANPRIGVPTPVVEIDELDADTPLTTAEAMMTTDCFSKLASAQGKVEGQPYRILGLAKGAGMIHPDMATMLVFVNDDSADHAETRAFLARRIEGIMRFEKTKARLTANSDMHFSPARFLGRLRYPAR